MRTFPALIVVAALAGCSTAGPNAAPEPAGSTPQATSASPTATPTALATDLADGEHHARVTAYDAARHTVTVDVVQFFSGQAAVDAAVDDGHDAGDVANDHYTRNDNPRLRTLTVADDVRIVVNTLAFERNGSSTKDTTISGEELAGYVADGTAPRALFRLTIESGAVVALDEQFLP